MNRTKIAYGEHPEQFGHLYLPDVPSADTLSVALIVHGGSWSGDYALNMGTQYAIECARAGMAAWNIEYRRVGAGGTWPETSADVLAALQAVGTVVQAQSTVPLNTDDVRVLGHSAGGQLAVWLAGETDAPIRPSLVVAQAGVLDLVVGPEGGQPSPSVEALMGATYAEAPELYRSASPMHRGFTGVRVHCVHGDRDELVPLSHSTRYVDAATAAGDEAALTVVEGEGHFEFLQVGTGSWSASMAALLGPASE
ncbi:MAG: alpha/beta hydrolase [Rhodococcus sp. (in: high G+C Gram-positive bacteria)]